MLYQSGNLSPCMPAKASVLVLEYRKMAQRQCYNAKIQRIIPKQYEGRQICLPSYLFYIRQPSARCRISIKFR